MWSLLQIKTANSLKHQFIFCQQKEGLSPQTCCQFFVSIKSKMHSSLTEETEVPGGGCMEYFQQIFLCFFVSENKLRAETLTYILCSLIKKQSVQFSQYFLVCWLSMQTQSWSDVFQSVLGKINNIYFWLFAFATSSAPSCAALK